MKRIVICFGLVVISSATCIAQTTGTSDWEAWSALSLEYKPVKKLKISLEEQLRLKENISTVDKYFTELSAEYKILKDFKLGLAGRYIRENDNKGKKQGYENHVRYGIYAEYEQELNSRIKLDYRLQFQTQNELGVSAAEGDVSKDRLRLKIGADYNIKNWKLDPKVAIELFKEFESSDMFNQYRATIGTDYELTKKLKVGAFYRLQRTIFEIPSSHINILGLQLGYRL